MNTKRDAAFPFDPPPVMARPAAQRLASHPEYPLERVCSYPSEPFQLAFARSARQHFLTREDIEAQPSHHGLTIRGETEDVIDGAVAMLRDLYGPRIRTGPPTILYHRGLTLEQPWMGLRLRCAAEHREAVHADLMDRDAAEVSCRIDGGFCEIAARAPLASLLGYRSALGKLTAGSAQCTLWLSHYAPIEPPPPHGRAA